MYCKHCGKEIADDSKFCQFCSGDQDSQRKNKNAIIADGIISVSKIVFKELAIGLIICMIIVAISTIIVNLYYGGNWGTDGGTVVFSIIVILIVGRYIVKLVKWVNINKSK